MKFDKDFATRLWSWLVPFRVSGRALWNHVGLFFSWLVSFGDRWNASLRQLVRTLKSLRSPYTKSEPLEEDWDPILDSGTFEVRLSHPSFRVYAHIRDVGEEWFQWLFPGIPKEGSFVAPWQPPDRNWLESRVSSYHLPLFFQMLRHYPKEKFFEDFVRVWGYELILAYPRYPLYQAEVPIYGPVISGGSETPYDPNNPPRYGYGAIALVPQGLETRQIFYTGKGPFWILRKEGSNYLRWLNPGEVWAGLVYDLETTVTDPTFFLPTLEDFLRNNIFSTIGVWVFPLLVMGEDLELSNAVVVYEDSNVVGAYAG